MFIKKDTIVTVKHARKGTFKSRAYEDFDTEKDEWYPIETLELVRGMSTYWDVGDKIPCRASLCTIQI